MINQITSGSALYGVESTILTLSPGRVSRTIQVNGTDVHRCQSILEVASTKFSLSVFYRFYELAKKADIIVYHFPWPMMDLVHLMSPIKKPSIVVYHSDIIRQKKLLQLYKPIKYLFLRSVNKIIATSPNYLQTSHILQKYKKKVEVIPIGLNKDSYAIHKPEKREYWEKKIGSNFFLFLGVLRYYKGLEILLEALALKEFPVVIVGAGPIETQLKEKAITLGLKKIIFLGQVSEEDKVAVIHLSFASVFPSNLRSEAFGISLLEGAMYGKPMISSEIGTGTSYVNVDGLTGIVVPPSSPKDLSNAMEYLWQNPDVAKTMGNNAAQRYSELFTADKMCQSYASLYERILSQKN